MEKTKPKLRSPIKRNVLPYKKLKKLKPGLIAFYDIQPGKGAGLISKKKTREEVSKKKVEKRG